MSLTSYQAAPPRETTMSIQAGKATPNLLPQHRRFAFRICATWLRRGEIHFGKTAKRKNPCRYGELVGPGVCAAVVSEGDAGKRAAWLVRAAFRSGRGQLNVLFRARSPNRRAMVCGDAG